MALSLRFRRALALSSSILKDRYFSSITSSSQPFSPLKLYHHLVRNPSSRAHSLVQSQFFRSAAVLNRDRRFDQNQPEIGPDDILFEGCDYNHWLITIDFPKDPAPSREEMLETYVQTAAKVFGSVEEAKQKIYACSTTTYQGFQCICDEATSEKFKGLPGVVFILPDSYIDPVNKEYGGDKYENGVITPRPPPIQYGRQGRYGDRNRNYDQPRYNRPRDPVPPPQDGRGFGAPPQDGRGFGPPSQDGGGFGPRPQDGRGFGAPPQDGRSYGPPQQDGRGYGAPPQDGRGYGAPPQDRRGYGPPPQDGRGFVPPPQDGRGYGPPPQDGRGVVPPPQDGRGFIPRSQEGRGFGGPSHDGRGYGPPPQDGRGNGQGEQRDQIPHYQSGFHQGQSGNPPPQEQRNFSQGSGYAGGYQQGPGFDHGPSSADPAEGQWQAKR